MERTRLVLRAALESIEDGLLVVSKSGRVSLYNDQFLELWSLPKELAEGGDDAALLDLAMSRLVEPETFRAGVEAIYDGTQTTRDTLRFSDGRVVERFSTPLESSGEPERMWLFRDVTARVRAEESLRAREAQLSSILRAVPVGICLVVDGVVREVNEGMLRISGYSRQECVDRPLAMHYAGEDELSEAEKAFQSLDESTSIAAHDSRWRRKDGEIIHVSIQAALLDSSDPSRGTTFAVADVTERRRGEAELFANRALLAESQRAAKIGSWDLDLSTHALTWTEECFRIYGYDPGEFEPTLDGLWDLIVEEDRAVAKEHFAATMAAKAFAPFDVRIQRRDGAVRWVHLVGVVECDSNGVPIRLVGTQQDVTLRKEQEEVRLELERRLQHAQKLESLGVLAGGIAHDFNNLLMAIMGNLDLALMHVPEEAPERRHLEQSENAARRAADLTRQMLAYSGRGKMTVSHVDLTCLVEENANLLRASVSKLHTLELRLDRSLPRMSADASQLQQVVMNLVTNASESMQDRPGTVLLSTGAVDHSVDSLRANRVSEPPSPGRFVFVEVRDEGCGMDQVTQNRLFEPFFTTKFMGRGLGMSVVLGIVRAHNGAVFVDSKLGGGTSVRVLFPVAQEAAERTTPKPGLLGHPDGIVLIVDDEESVRSVCQAMVDSLGWKTLSVDCGAAALECIRQRGDEIVCVLLDLSMPQMDGATVFREIRKLRSEMPVILSSGFTCDKDSVVELWEEGLTDFIQKPYDLKSLRRTLSRAVPATIMFKT